MEQPIPPTFEIENRDFLRANMEFQPAATVFHANSCARGEKALPLPGREQQARSLAGLIPSIKQSVAGGARQGGNWAVTAVAASHPGER